jgi:hypothetical protein
MSQEKKKLFRAEDLYDVGQLTRHVVGRFAN